MQPPVTLFRQQVLHDWPHAMLAPTSHEKSKRKSLWIELYSLEKKT